MASSRSGHEEGCKAVSSWGWRECPVALTFDTRKEVKQYSPEVGKLTEVLQPHLLVKKDVQKFGPEGGKLTEVLQPRLWDEEGGQTI